MNVRIFWVRAMKCMCAQTRPRFILSSEGVFQGMEFEPMLTPREKSPVPENVPRGGSNPRRCGQRAQALPTELFRSPLGGLASLCTRSMISDCAGGFLGKKTLPFDGQPCVLASCLLNIPAMYKECLRDRSAQRLYMLPHCRSKLLSHSVTVHWHSANQF